MRSILKEKVNDHWYKTISQLTWICIWTLYNIINNDWWYFNRNILNRLYKYTKSNKDDRYYSHVQNRTKPTFNVWLYIRTKRLEHDISITDMSKHTKLSVRTLERIESNTTNPTEYSLNQICNYLLIDDLHKKTLLLYTQSFKLLNQILWL